MALFGRKKPAPVVEEVEERPTLPPPPAPNAAGLRTVNDHRDYLLSLVEPLPPFGMPLIDALGLALCEDITAPWPLPRHPVSDVAGVAVHADDVADAAEDFPVTLTVVEVADDAELEPGQAAVVREQGRVPEGADAVLPWPFTDRGESEIKVFEPVKPDENLRRAGSDVPDEQVVGTAGQVLDDRTLALLAGVGIDKVLARPRPRVVVISQGADLVEPGRRLTSHEAQYDATGVLVAAAARRAGCQVWRVLVASDDPVHVLGALTDQLIRADLVITTSGVLDPDATLMREVVEQLGRCDFADVALRPGRRQGFALVGDDHVPLLMLPSNPLAAHASFHAFVRPLLRRLAGAAEVEHRPVRTFTSRVVRSPQGLTSILRAVVHDEGGRHRVEVLPISPDDQFSGLARCNALAVIGDDVEVVNAGEPLSCWMLDRD